MRTLWLRVLFFGSLSLALCAPAQATSVVAAENVQVFQETVRHQNSDRTVLVLRPAVPASSTPPPVFVLLHFLDGSASEMANLVEISKLVRDRGAWVLLPQAIEGNWNHTPNPADDLGDTIGAVDLHAGLVGFSAVDDVGFLARMIDELTQRHGLDAHRVYMGGYSNGALMTVRFACERPDKIAGGAVVGATMRNTQQPECQPPLPVSMIYINGTADQVAPYAGSTTSLSADAALAFWVQANGCAPTPQHSTLPDTQPDGTSTSRRAWRSCTGGVGVDHLTVQGGGHTWPGTIDFTPSLGHASQDYQASDVIWDFFLQYSR